jgi:hypothetical protein
MNARMSAPPIDPTADSPFDTAVEDAAVDRAVATAVATAGDPVVDPVVAASVDPSIDPASAASIDPVQQSGVAAPLANGAVLGPYRVTGVVGQGGFGIVYRAEDPATGVEVAIKEFLPAQLATRRADGGLEPASPGHAETFSAGLEGFLDEARLLARVRHPGLVEVLQAWEQNGTAYMSMPRYEGPTLERLIATHPAGIDAPMLQSIVAPLLGALATIHAAGCVHRDVSPDNVIVRPGAGAVLLDLGAARRVVGDRVRAMTVMLKAGYAPIEQYADDPDCRIGPWSDVYALAAVMHHAATGTAPPPSPLRVMRDTRVPLVARAPAGYEPAFLDAVDAAMSLRPEDRPQSAHAFRARLGLPDEAPGLGSVGPLTVPAAGGPSIDDRKARRHAAVRRAGPFALTATMIAVFAASVLVWLLAAPGGQPADAGTDTLAVAAEPSGDTFRTEAWARRAAAQAALQAAAAAQAGPRDAALAAPATTRAVVPRTATLRLAVTPWAEVWVDGVRRGVTPPTMSIALAPGARRIELRNPAAEPVLRNVDVRAGQTVDLSHRFAAQGAR